MKIVAFVPAKGASERIPSKNLKILDGEHLFRRKLKQLLACKEIDEVWLDTESEELIKLCSDLSIKIMKRDANYATNATDGHELFKNECLQVPDADIVIQALCTAPFLDSSIISQCISKLVANPDHDSLITVNEQKQYLWEGGQPVYGNERIPNSVDLPTYYVETMSLYMMRKISECYPDKRFGVSPILFPLNAKQSTDINNVDDLELAEEVCRGARMKEASYFQILKYHLSSAIISDVCKELGKNYMLKPDIHPVSQGKMLGRVRTLKLGALSGEESDMKVSSAWKGIYKALDSYKFVRSGDVIVVETSVPDRAYFGDLNCHLAMRAGAVGVLVDGFTRDVESVQAMGLPVYAKGAWGNDIKFEGTTISYNFPIEVGGVKASNDDVIFADSEGIHIIPSEKWDEVLKEVLKATTNERHIRQNLLNGTPIEEVIEQFGFF